MNSSINCPHCNQAINVDELLQNQVESRIRKEMQEDYNKRISSFQKDKELFFSEKEKFEKYKENEREAFYKKLEEEKKIIREEEERKLKSQTEAVLKSLQDKMAESQKEVFSLKQKELEAAQREQFLKQELELELKKRMLEQHEHLTQKIQQEVQEKTDKEKLELQKKLEDQKKLIDEMNRKAHQGSMQLQGEVMELELENMLKQTYPFDIIEEVAKGVKGADVIQTVRNAFQQNCGKIIYESKRTKAFSDSWIDKLKEDLRHQNADIALLVTETMPKDMSKFGFKEGVWICSFAEITSVSYVLREMILKVYAEKGAQENKGDKMSLLYHYLTGNEFRQHIEAIVEGFSTMKEDLDKEKNAMQKIWKQREKQIEKVIENTVSLYGSIKGIAGNAIENIDSLELGA